MSKISPSQNISKSRFYTRGKIIWNFSDQPSFVPENFLVARNASQAWHYKVSTLAMFVLILTLVYGGWLGYQYYDLTNKQKGLDQKLVEAKRKEEEIKKKASAVFTRMMSVEKKLAYDTVRQPIGVVLHDIAKRLPSSFYIQNLSINQTDDLKDEKGTSVGTRRAIANPRQREKEIFYSLLVNTISVTGRMIGIGSEATEYNLVQAYKNLPGFQIISVKGSSDGLDVNFQYTHKVEFAFTPKPAELFAEAKPQSASTNIQPNR